MGEVFTKVLYYLSEFGRFFNRQLSGGEINYYGLIFLFLLFAFFIIGVSLGRTRSLLSLLSIFIAAYLERYFIFMEQLGGYLEKIPEYWLRAGLFVIFYIIAFLTLNRSILKSRLTLNEASIFSVLFIALAQLGLFLSIISNFLPAETELPRPLTLIFASNVARFSWAWLALIVTAILVPKKGKKTAKLAADNDEE